MILLENQTLEEVFFERKGEEAKILFLIHKNVTSDELLDFAKEKMEGLETEELSEVTFVFHTKPESGFFVEPTFKNLTIEGIHKNAVKLIKQPYSDYEVIDRLVSVKTSSLLTENDFRVYGEYQELIRKGQGSKECITYLSTKYNQSPSQLIKQLSFVQEWWDLNFTDREGIDLFKF